MRVLCTVATFVIACFMVLLPMPVSAADVQERGLSIAPLRKEVGVRAGATAATNFIVANLTRDTMTVNLAVKQFSATNFVYDYEFRPPDNDWVKVESPQIQLEPGESRKVSYTITIPEKTAPGGYYYTIFASTDISSGLPTTVQAATLLYLTVEGELIRTSVLQNDSLPFLITSNKIPYKFDVKNTGNVHFSAYFYGQLESLLGKYPESGTSHVILPGSVRTVGGSIQAPLLPGIYKVKYGYKVDFADFEIAKTAYIAFIPPWSIIVLVLSGIAARWFWRKRRNTVVERPD